MNGPTIDFWQGNFEAGITPWDRGATSPQLIAWLGTEIEPGRTILVPGCGSGWEVATLSKFGAAVTGIDYARAAVARTDALLAAEGLHATVVQADVLAWQPPRAVDAVYEQTCLCALYPDHWTAYAAQLHRWIVPGGKLLALFMQKLRPAALHGSIEGPPYHCDINAMRALFPSDRWTWPKPPYATTPHPMALHELGVVLIRR